MSNQHLDPTFRNYTATQASAYAKERGAYPAALYSTILNHHVSNKGSCNLVMDVGCGAGNATRQIAAYFDSAIGVDPGAQMIAVAQSLGGTTRSGRTIRYEVCAAEELSNVVGVERGSVDLITCAMAAHWFDMSRFWNEAAALLKPGGTVALWVCSSLYCHPLTPNAAEVQRILFRLERKMLAPYETPSNRLARDLYDDLLLPWDVQPKIESFSEADIVRREWDRDGVLSDGVDFFGGTEEVTLEQLGMQLGTASMVTRWREANPDTMGAKDCVAMTLHDLKEALNGQERLLIGNALGLLLLKKDEVDGSLA